MMHEISAFTNLRDGSWPLLTIADRSNGYNTEINMSHSCTSLALAQDPWVRNLPFFSPNPMDSTFSTFPTFPPFHFSTFPQKFGPKVPRRSGHLEKFHGIESVSKSSTASNHFPKAPWGWHGNPSFFLKVPRFPFFRLLKNETTPKVPRITLEKVNMSSGFQFSESWKVKSLQKFHGNPKKRSTGPLISNFQTLEKWNHSKSSTEAPPPRSTGPQISNFQTLVK